jgi:hypothetical protein
VFRITVNTPRDYSSASNKAQTVYTSAGTTYRWLLSFTYPISTLNLIDWISPRKRIFARLKKKAMTSTACDHWTCPENKSGEAQLEMVDHDKEAYSTYHSTALIFTASFAETARWN